MMLDRLRIRLVRWAMPADLRAYIRERLAQDQAIIRMRFTGPARDELRYARAMRWLDD